ncbi:serine/threonine protein kinase [Aneurinibacillus tyrosinisolvens]|uniref:serine/threonine protein kinase n=1 Tax=Aneurinibacillus tyrosinisolvens TaxID=1443435 RepID=UPI000699BAA3|nr:serine/threonine protein kinase [Aneurinibacillus tyrosinisolvens]
MALPPEQQYDSKEKQNGTLALFIKKTEADLLSALQVESIDPYDPVDVSAIPSPWKTVGAGNYAAVVFHPGFPDWVVKIYAPGRPGLSEEASVYRKLGPHPAYSECLHEGKNYLVLKRLKGVTLYDCLHRGIRIPKKVIKDIDDALEYARTRGLHPCDVHGKNVMLVNGRGVVVDVSDFYKTEACSKWEDVKKAYYKVYLPFFYRFPVPVPYSLLNIVRKGYRFYKKLRK